MSIVKDIKQLAVDGNVVSVAIGVILGNALCNVISSLMTNILVPVFLSLFSPLVSGHDYTISMTFLGSSPSVIQYGAFLKTVFDLIISAATILFVIKHINAIMHSFDPVIKLCPFCCAKLPVKATKCQQCSSVLPSPENKEPQ
jgi:large conductance mechanosensitive channel